jgi:hypothetical protein
MVLASGVRARKPAGFGGGRLYDVWALSTWASVVSEGARRRSVGRAGKLPEWARRFAPTVLLARCFPFCYRTGFVTVRLVSSLYREERLRWNGSQFHAMVRK